MRYAILAGAFTVLVTAHAVRGENEERKTDPPAERGAARPADAWSCPPSHPIKGNLTTRSGECIYHVRGGAFYEKTKPEVCFATHEDARRYGCRPSKR
jgi:hypothetical protein